MASYNFGESQYERTEKTKLDQEKLYIETNLDNKESVLYNLQLIFLIDISGSMAETDVDPEGVGKDGLLGRGRWTRYDNMVKILKAMTSDLLKFDKDGKLPCYFFHNQVKRVEFTDPNLLIAQVRQFKPEGTTALHVAFQESLKDLNDVDNFLFIVFTDGVPDDTLAVENFISREIHGKDLRGDRLNVLFVRFGDNPGAVQYLQDLDDHPVFSGNVDVKSDNAAFKLGPKLLVLNAIYEELEKEQKWRDLLATVP